jgi:hypothetical protein
MATDTKTGADRTFEVMDMAKTWKEGYLKGLETSLQWQEQNQQLVKEAVRQDCQRISNGPTCIRTG